MSPRIHPGRPSVCVARQPTHQQPRRGAGARTVPAGRQWRAQARTSCAEPFAKPLLLQPPPGPTRYCRGPVRVRARLPPLDRAAGALVPDCVLTVPESAQREQHQAAPSLHVQDSAAPHLGRKWHCSLPTAGARQKSGPVAPPGCEELLHHGPQVGRGALLQVEHKEESIVCVPAAGCTGRRSTMLALADHNMRAC